MMQDGEVKANNTIKLNRKLFTALVVIAGVGLATASFALPIAINSIEKGSGVVVTPACLANARINFSYSVASNGNTSISQVRITNVGTECTSNFISLKITNSSDTTVDEIIWSPTTAIGDTSITLRADGSTTSTADASSGGILTSWPDSQAAPEGLQSIAATSVETATLTLLSASRAATN